MARYNGDNLPDSPLPEGLTPFHGEDVFYLPLDRAVKHGYITPQERDAIIASRTRQNRRDKERAKWGAKDGLEEGKEENILRYIPLAEREAPLGDDELPLELWKEGGARLLATIFPDKLPEIATLFGVGQGSKTPISGVSGGKSGRKCKGFGPRHKGDS